MRGLQVIYSVFLGLAVAAFVGIGTSTFYPRPKADFSYPLDETNEAAMQAFQAEEEAYSALVDTWSLNTSIILLVVATALLVLALVMGERLVVISNGMLLGGLFILLYAVANSFSNSENVLRFAVITVALVVTIAVGWFRFRLRPAAAPETAGRGAAQDGAEAAAPLEARITELENRLDALRRALGG